MLISSTLKITSIPPLFYYRSLQLEMESLVFPELSIISNGFIIAFKSMIEDF